MVLSSTKPVDLAENPSNEENKDLCLKSPIHPPYARMEAKSAEESGKWMERLNQLLDERLKMMFFFYFHGLIACFLLKLDE